MPDEDAVDVATAAGASVLGDGSAVLAFLVLGATAPAALRLAGGIFALCESFPSIWSLLLIAVDLYALSLWTSLTSPMASE